MSYSNLSSISSFTFSSFFFFNNTAPSEISTLSLHDALPIFDLSGLATAHSVVLSMLLCWHRLALEKQQSLTFQGASDRLLSLAALSNLEDQIPGFATHS